MAQQEVALKRESLWRRSSVSMRISSVSVTGLVSGVSDVRGIDSSVLVSLEAAGGSNTGIASVFAPLELVPDTSVGVLKKNSTTEMSRL